MVKLKVKLLHPEAKVPKYQHIGDAGMDLHSIEDVIIPPFETVGVKLGVALEIEEGYEVQIRPRSGLALKHSITVQNSPGTIDSNYRGEIRAIIYNGSNQEFHITEGMRICQMVVNKIPSVEIEVVDYLSDSNRGTGAYGSTGTH